MKHYSKEWLQQTKCMKANPMKLMTIMHWTHIAPFSVPKGLHMALMIHSLFTI